METALPLGPRNIALLQDVTPTLGAHIATVNYRFEPLTRTPSTWTKTFATVEELWTFVLDKTIAHEVDVVLSDVFLLDWFPRAPGLFYSDSGRTARSNGEHRRETLPDGTEVYSPLGKLDMLQGGIGSVRLKPISIEGEKHYLMAATSTGVGHEAFPVALPRELYRAILDEISIRGAVPVSVVGTLEYVPDKFDALYWTDVPRLYLRAEELRAPSKLISRNSVDISVAVAVTVARSSQDKYASFVNFDPGRQLSFDHAIDWMQNSYVGHYGGKIITDYDERESHFGDAPFSLARLMSLDIDQAAASVYIQDLHLYGVDQWLTRVETIKVNQMSIDKSVTVTGGNIGAIGVDSNNVTGNVRQTSVLLNGPEARDLVQRIESAFEAAKPSVDAKKADRIARDIGQLKEEVSAENPNRQWYSVSLNGIKEAAAAIGDVGIPLLKAATQLITLVGLG